ncbi:hypothetical protein ColTof3_07809 [Colletotrichum tofieldiae]|nr:hypothetical protein ColTof3_07809 [Colletotrichum tofieldiae]
MARVTLPGTHPQEPPAGFVPSVPWQPGGLFSRARACLPFCAVKRRCMAPTPAAARRPPPAAIRAAPAQSQCA